MILIILLLLILIIIVNGYDISNSKSMFAVWYKKTKDRLEKEEILKPVLIDSIYSNNNGKLGKSLVNYSCKPFSTSKLRYIRSVSFYGEGYDIFNFVVLPWSYYDLPILGIDIVSLPGGVLAAVDFQPLIFDNESYFQEKSYSLYSKKFQDIQNSLPSGGNMPEAALKFFSPYALWTRIPPNDDRLDVIANAVDTYVDAYASLLNDVKKIDDILLIKKRQENMKTYLNYRIENDPAKNMLNGAFGIDWTKTVIKDVFFPFE